MVLNIKILFAMAYSSLSILGIKGITFQYSSSEMKPVINDSVKEALTDSILSGDYILKYDMNGDGNLDISDLYIMNCKLKKNEANKKSATEFSETTVSETTAPVITSDTASAVETTVQTTSAATAPVPVTQPEAIAETVIDDSDIISNGIDVSAWQGEINWTKVKAAGISFAMIKAGGGTSVSDCFAKNIAGAQAAGINCGVYWFSYAKSSAEAELEAQACLNAISGYKLEYPVVYDCEYRSLNDNPLKNSKSQLTDMVLTFLNKIQQSGYYAMYYTNKDFSDKYLELDRITKDFDIWFAGYTVSEPLIKCGIWQRSETGTVDGISGYVDLDISYKNYPAKMKKYHVNGY